MILLPLHDILQIPLEKVCLVVDNPRSPRISLSAKKAREQLDSLVKSPSIRRAVSLDEIGAYSRWTSAPSSFNTSAVAPANAQGPFTKPSTLAAAAIGKKLLERSARNLDKKPGMSFGTSCPPPDDSPPPLRSVSHDTAVLRKPRRTVSPERGNHQNIGQFVNGQTFRKTLSLNEWSGSSRLCAGSQNRNPSNHSNYQWSVPSSSSSRGIKRTLNRSRLQSSALAGIRTNGLLNLRPVIRSTSPGKMQPRIPHSQPRPPVL